MYSFNVNGDFFVRFFEPRHYYNTFVCTRGVAWYIYDRKKGTIQEYKLLYEDKEFLKKLPKKNKDFYNEALKRYLDYVKNKLENGESVKLFFNKYILELSQNHFYVWKKYRFLKFKEKKPFIKNFLYSIRYNSFNEVDINSNTNKRVTFKAPMFVKHFLWDYALKIAKVNLHNTKGVSFSNQPPWSNALMILIAYFGIFSLSFGAMLYILGLLLDNMNSGIALLGGFIAVIFTEVVVEYFFR